MDADDKWISGDNNLLLDRIDYWSKQEKKTISSTKQDLLYTLVILKLWFAG